MGRKVHSESAARWIQITGFSCFVNEHSGGGSDFGNLGRGLEVGHYCGSETHQVTQKIEKKKAEFRRISWRG